MVTAVSGFIEQGEGGSMIKGIPKHNYLPHIPSSFKKLAVLSVSEPDISQQMDAYELIYVG